MERNFRERVLFIYGLWKWKDKRSKISFDEGRSCSSEFAIREIYPNDFALRQPEDEKALLPINRLTGSDVLAHDWPDFDALMERWENEAKAFDERAAFARIVLNTFEEE